MNRRQRQMCIRDSTNTTCIFINQLREKIGVMFGPAETTTGGNALKFYASVRIDIRSRNPIKDGDDVLGKRAYIKVVKNKVAPPFKRAEFDIMFGEGISKAGEILDLGVEYDVIKKSGSWFSYADSKIGQGRDAAKRYIQENPDVAAELEKKIMDAMYAADHDGELRPAKKSKKADDENDTPRPVDETVDDAPEAPDNLFDEEFDLEEDL